MKENEQQQPRFYPATYQQEQPAYVESYDVKEEHEKPKIKTKYYGSDIEIVDPEI